MSIEKIIGIGLGLFFIGLIAASIVQPIMESRTYNKLTGANTTWWDALWVELRVQDAPKEHNKYP